MPRRHRPPAALAARRSALRLSARWSWRARTAAAPTARPGPAGRPDGVRPPRCSAASTSARWPPRPRSAASPGRPATPPTGAHPIPGTPGSWTSAASGSRSTPTPCWSASASPRRPGRTWPGSPVEPVAASGTRPGATDQAAPSRCRSSRARRSCRCGPEAERREAVAAGQVAAVAGEIAGQVPVDPPETDDQTERHLRRVDPAAVVRRARGDRRGRRAPSPTRPVGHVLLGDRRSVTRGPWRSSVYTNAYAGPFLADQKTPSRAPGAGVTGELHGPRHRLRRRRGRPGRLGQRDFQPRSGPASHCRSRRSSRRCSPAPSPCCSDPAPVRRTAGTSAVAAGPCRGRGPPRSRARSPPGTPRCPPYPRRRRPPGAPRRARTAR